MNRCYVMSCFLPAMFSINKVTSHLVFINPDSISKCGSTGIVCINHCTLDVLLYYWHRQKASTCNIFEYTEYDKDVLR
jgi:hypothetical protein